MLNIILQQAEEIPAVSASAAGEYAEKRGMLVGYVNAVFENSPDLPALIGNNPLQVIYDNHTNHASFMSTVLRLGLYKMMVRMVLWVYRSYHARGFSYDYFVLELKTWLRAVREHLAAGHAGEVAAVYEWLLAHHQQFIDSSGSVDNFEEAKDPQLLKVRSSFLNCLLKGETRVCLELADEFVKSSKDIAEFYLNIIQPAMYEVGRRWERGEVSVAQEHLASAIVARVMSSLYPAYVLATQRQHRKAVVTAAPNEFHEMGAHMISDFLEMDGWDVYYLGSNTPAAELKKMLLEKKPFLLAVSATMPFNLVPVEEIITMVRADKILADLKIMLGGLVFNQDPHLSEQLGADGWAPDARVAVELAHRWYEEAQHNGVE